MNGRVRFSIRMAVVTTTDREFRVNLPHRRLLCAVRGAAKTPQNAEAKPGTAVGRPTEPTGPMPAERDGPCTCEVGVWVSRRNGRAGRRGRDPTKEIATSLSQMPCGRPDHRSSLPRGERPSLLACSAAETRSRRSEVARRPVPSQRRRRTSRRCRGRSPPNFLHVGRANPPIFLLNPGQQPLNLGVARKPAPATTHARTRSSTKAFLVVRRRQPPVTRPATSMDVTSDSWLVLRVEGGAHVAAPPPRQSAGPAPTRGDAHRRHPSWGPIPFRSQNLVHKSECWSLDAATGTTVTVSYFRSRSSWPRRRWRKTVIYGQRFDHSPGTRGSSPPPRPQATCTGRRGRPQSDPG